jgi:hypothetical protein
MESVAPVNIGGSFFDIFVDINNSGGAIPQSMLPQPDALTPSTGSLTVTENASGTGGTYTSTLNVFADVLIEPTGTGTIAQHIPDLIGVTLSSTGGTWSTTPGATDLHNATYPAGGFYITNVGTHTGPHPVTQSTAPEPASYILMGAGICALAMIKWRKRDNR